MHRAGRSIGPGNWRGQRGVTSLMAEFLALLKWRRGAPKKVLDL